MATPDTVQHALNALGWEFVPTGPNEWEWRKFDAAGRCVAAQGGATWVADVARAHGTAPPQRRPKIYVAGPYSKPDPEANTLRAMAVWDELWGAGYAPFCPHWSHFQHQRFPRSYEDWMAADQVWLDVCDAVLRLPGESAGADREVERASGLGIPVFATREALDAWRAAWLSRGLTMAWKAVWITDSSFVEHPTDPNCTVRGLAEERAVILGQRGVPPELGEPEFHNANADVAALAEQAHRAKCNGDPQ